MTTLRADLRPGGAAESYRIDAGPAALTVTGDLAGVTAGLPAGRPDPFGR